MSDNVSDGVHDAATDRPDAERGVARRTVVLAGAGALVVTAAGCTEYGDEGGGDGTRSTPPAREQSGSARPPAAGGRPLGTTSEVPEGGGKVFTAEKVVVTQPVRGDFKAFTAVCTHQGCLVDKVEDGTIDCPCHGSRFRIEDGAVAQGPARRPLAAERITVSGDEIRLT
ncbi:Rieske (2Fe-2S) protein [Streptomyces sp. NPDC091376]|uniref:Rieske (2Fe-2S) protein n=1 Tax=Streptomyces sp. NPDC091376 TaxID=3365994 RepID=UPI00380281F3